MKENTTKSNTTLQIKNKIESNKFIKISRFRKEIRVTEPHKHHNYFEIIYLSKGSGNHYIDNISYKVETPVLFFIRKEQVHNWELFSEPDGFVLIIKKNFIDHSLDLELKKLFVLISSFSKIHVANSKTIENIFNALLEENTKTSSKTNIISEALLKALLAKINELAVLQIENYNPKSDMYLAFLNLLNSSESLRNNVAYYANLLNTSPQNLNAICKKTTNKTASEIISEFIISEAKRLLIYTSITVNEIAFKLNFTDASHFIKYFKRATNQTPTQFKKNI